MLHRPVTDSPSADSPPTVGSTTVGQSVGEIASSSVRPGTLGRMRHRLTRRVVEAFEWTPGRPGVAEGVRAGIITSLPLVVGIWFPHPWLTWASLGGFMGVLGDKGGAYRTRALRFIALAALGGLAAAAGSLLGSPPLLAVVAMLVIGTGLTLLRAHPTVVGSVAGPATIVFAVSLELPAQDIAGSLQRAPAFAVGLLLAMVLAVGVFPFRYYSPARAAVAHCYRLLAARLEELRGSARSGAGAQEWLQAAQRANPRLREALEQARSVVSATRYGREAESERGERLLVLVENADQLMATTMSLADAMEGEEEGEEEEGEGEGERRGSGTFGELTALAERCRRVAAWTADPGRGGVHAPAASPPGATAPTIAGGTGAADGPPSPVTHQLARFALFLGGAEEAAAGLEASSGSANLTWMVPRLAMPQPRRWVAPLRQELNLASVPMRHALRTGVVAAVAVALVRLLDVPYGQWVTLVAIIVIQPYAGASTVKGLQRVVGTMAGGVVAALLGPFMHSPVSSVPILFLMAGLAVAVFPLNYAAYAFFSTPTFVLLTELRAGSWHLASIRSADTLLGAALALAGSAFLWPVRERGIGPAALAGAVAAARDYATFLFGEGQPQLPRGPAPGSVDDPATTSGASSGSLMAMRRRVSLALLDADLTVRRLVAEHPPGSPVVEAQMAVVAYTRRLAMSLTAIAMAERADAVAPAAGMAGPSAAALPATPLPPLPEGLGALVVSALGELSTSLEEGRRPVRLEALDGLVGGPATPATRLARQLIVLTEAVERSQGPTA